MEPNKHKGSFYTKNGRKIYLVKGICDFFSGNTFYRLLEEQQFAANNNAKFYVGLYSSPLLEKTGKFERKLKSYIRDIDRVTAVEALDFVDGAFLINSINLEQQKKELEAKLFNQDENKIHRENRNNRKKYQIGYASGAFTNLHKGHIEHLRMMAEQCDTVIVAANSDRLIREYKHKEPTVDENTRRLILSKIKYVDLAIISDIYDKIEAIEIVKKLCGKHFDAIFVGTDWKGNSNWKEFEKRFSKYGIDIVFTERPKNGISTSQIDLVNNKKANGR